VNIHSDVNVGDEKTSAKRFQFRSCGEGVDATDDNVARPQRSSLVLPACRKRLKVRVRTDGPIQAASNFDLWAFCHGILSGRTDKPVQIRTFAIDSISIERTSPLESDVRQLLHNVGASSAQADNPDSHLFE